MLEWVGNTKASDFWCLGSLIISETHSVRSPHAEPSVAKHPRPTTAFFYPLKCRKNMVEKTILYAWKRMNTAFNPQSKNSVF